MLIPSAGIGNPSDLLSDVDIGSQHLMLSFLFAALRKSILSVPTGFNKTVGKVLYLPIEKLLIIFLSRQLLVIVTCF